MNLLVLFRFVIIFHNDIKILPQYIKSHHEKWRVYHRLYSE